MEEIRNNRIINVTFHLTVTKCDVVDVWHLLALANHGCCNFDRALELLDHADALNEKQGGPPKKSSDIQKRTKAPLSASKYCTQQLPLHSLESSGPITA